MLLIFAVAILARGLLYLVTWITTDVSPAAVFLGHDGVEYLAFAEIIGTGAQGELPANVVRHDAGYPALLALLWNLMGRLASLLPIAFGAQAASLLFVLIFTSHLYRAIRPGNNETLILAGAALAYPATVYYGLFNLTEPVFTALLLGSLVFFAKRHYYLAFTIAGLSATVRSTGLLLVVALLLAQAPTLFQGQRSMKIAALKFLAHAVLGLLPWVCAQTVTRAVFGSDVSSHGPQFGWPFSGFRGFSTIGKVRSIYLLASVSFFIATTVRFIYIARSQRWQDTLINGMALFSGTFVLFHLCLKSLYYINQDVWTLNYQDRYLAPLIPLAVIAWAPWLKWRYVIPLILLSAAISTWWLKNYVPAAGLRF